MARNRNGRDDRTFGIAGIGCGALAVIVLATAGAAYWVTHRVADTTGGVPAPVAVANAAPPLVVTPGVPVATRATTVAPITPVSVPAGAGVTGSEVAGRPQVSVYFDTAKADVTTDFARVAAPLKAWLDGHAGARLAVSGFNDPRGNAAFNADLAKRRAQAVAAALAAAGVPAGSIDLVKPADTTDSDTSQAAARRVDVTITP